MAKLNERDEQLKNAAKCRALITSFLKNKSDASFTKGEIYEALTPELKKMSYTIEQFQTVLYSLVKNELVKRIEDGNVKRYCDENSKLRSSHRTEARSSTKSKGMSALDIVIGKHGDYAEITLKGVRLRISIGD